MGFWIYMLIMNLILPITMIFFGRYFSRKAPKEINWVFGYRTPMSTKNKDTWEFAHKYFGKIWYKFGIILFPITIFAMLCVIGKSEDTVGLVGGILCVIHLIVIIATIFPTESALKKNFDKYGNKRIQENSSMSRNDKIIKQNNVTKGTIQKVTKCWWIKVNTKHVRMHALDGAIFPHIMTFTYKVDGVQYKKRKYIGLRADAIGIFGNIDVYYDKEKPSRCAIKL